MTAITWTGAGGDDNFNNPANWSPQQVPGAADTVTIAPPAAVTINVTQGDAVGALTMSSKVTLAVGNGDSLTLGSSSLASTTIANSGVISLNSTYNGTDLIIGSNKTTLSGGGTILLGNYPGGNYIVGASATSELVNTNNLIEGGGYLGNGQLDFYNGGGGTVDANVSSQLVLNGGTITATNLGKLEATTGGNLLLEGTINQGTTGRILATNADVFLSADIQGGTLSSSGAGTILVSGSGTLDGTANTLFNTGLVELQNNTSLDLLGTISNAGTILLDSTYNGTDLLIGKTSGATASTVTLTGDGQVVLGDYPANYIYGGIAGDTLVNLNNTISGAGNIGQNQLNLVNDGTISATGTNSLVLNTGSTIINDGLFTSTNTGGLVIIGTVDDIGGGTLAAAAGNIYMQGATVEGGLLSSSGTGTIIDNGGATLDGTTQTVLNTTTVNINNNEQLTLLGTITNSGTIAVNSTYNYTALDIGSTSAVSTVTLTGGGTIAMGDYSANYLTNNYTGSTLINANNTIEGSGTIGNGTWTLINDGTISAVSASGSFGLVLDTNSTVTNNALIEAVGAGGGLTIQNTTVNDSGGGTLLANDGAVSLNNADIVGGLISAVNGGTIYDTNGATFDGTAQTVTIGTLTTVTINNNEQLTLLGTITNVGTIAVNSTYNYTALNIGSTSAISTVTLTGGGTIAMGDYPANYLTNNYTGSTLINLNNTIEGSGTIGNGTWTLINDATISAVSASGSYGLLLDTNSTVTNNALIEAVGAGGGLTIENTTVNDSGHGTLLANDGVVSLNNADIQGGLIEAVNGGTIYDTNGATFDGSAQTVTIGTLTTININNNEQLTLLGTITNLGTIAVNSTYNYTALDIGSTSAASTVTLTGGGTIALGDYPDNYLTNNFTGSTLINLNNTISGSGTIGYGTWTLINDGTISAVSASGNYGLVIDPGSTVINNSLIEAVGAGGGLTLYNTTVNDSGGGTILAANGTVSFNNATLQGGLIEQSGAAGLVQVTSYATLDGSSQTVTNQAAIQVQDNTTLTLLGIITNDGTISLDTNYHNTDLIAGSATVTLTGGGTISLGEGASNNRVYGATGTDTLVNLNNTIEGSGQIGAGQLTLINDATINANGTLALILDTGNTVTNNKLIEATGAGGLTIQSTTVNSGTAGTISAAAGIVSLQSATLQGGTLLSSGGGSFAVISSATLDGTAHTVINKGDVELNDNTTLTLLGTITNDGTIGLDSSYHNTDLIIGSPTLTLTGGGQIVLGNYPDNRLYGAAGTDTLVNVNNTISGAGQLGSGQLTLINDAAGIIDANDSNTLTLSSNGSTITNLGLIEATGTGGLSIQTAVNSTGGTILAANADVYLNGATMVGGLLSGTGSGAFIVNGNSTLNGVAHPLTNAATIDVNDNVTLTVLGVVNSTAAGTIALNSSYHNTDLIVSGTKTTFNGGTIELGNYPDNRVYGAATSNVLDLVGGTITGAGQLGAGQLTLLDNGVISATDSDALVLNLGSTGTIQGNGQLLGIGSGGLLVQNGTYSVSGLVEAESGSSVTFSNGATLTNARVSVSKGHTFDILGSGTFAAVAGSNGGATLSINSAALTSDNANLILSGAGSSILFDGTAIENSLTGISASGTLQIIGDRSYSTTLSLTDLGQIDLGGGTFTAKSIITEAGSVVSGFGTVATVLSGPGTLAAVGGTLDLTANGNKLYGPVTGSGTLSLDHGLTTLESGATLGVATIAEINAATLQLDGPITFAGIFDMVGANSLSGAAFTNNGLFEQTGTGGAAPVNVAFTNAGSILIGAGGGIAFTAGLTNSGTITDNGILKDSAALTGGTLNIGPSGANAVVASGSGAGNSTLSTLTIAGGGLNTSGTTLTVTGDYVNSAAGTGNSYRPFAGVAGTIDGQGTQLAVVGVDGTTITTVNGTLTVAIAQGGSASFEIENTGAAGSAALRGALQTTVNGGHISGRALTGSGVTAQNYGPIAAGGASGVFTIDYSSGTLSGEAIHLASDFANVAGLTIDIVAASGGGSVPEYGSRLPSADGFSTDWLALHHG